MKLNFTIPGLLFIDTPGHAAFTTLRKRGGAISDLAVLVVDINEGFMPQTKESVMFLKEFKTPFIVAATKIDRVLGWRPAPNACFVDTYPEQTERTKEEFEEKFYKLVGDLASEGINSDRFDRVSDFKKQVCIVPVSSITGEGIPDLLVMLAGLAQKYLSGRLEVSPGEGKGTVLEVKDYKGLGTTIDAIIYDGEVRRGDILVVGGREVVTTRIRALLKPEQMKEMRVEKKFLPLDSVTAAAGVKISAQDIEKVIPGSPIRTVRKETDIPRAEAEVKQEVSEVEIVTDVEGIMLKADTLGSLEALIKTLQDSGLPLRSAQVGDVGRQDVISVSTQKEPVIFAFGVNVTEEAILAARDRKVAIFNSLVIYKIMEDYNEWVSKRKERAEEQLLADARHPGRMKLIPGCVFRQCKPAVFGVEVLAGIVRAGYVLEKKGKPVGEIKEIQKSGESVEEAVRGDKVAISMNGVTIGKEISEGDVLDNHLRPSDLEKLNKVRGKLKVDEVQLLSERESG
jgi:translation initiation factor 5B